MVQGKLLVGVVKQGKMIGCLIKDELLGSCQVIALRGKFLATTNLPQYKEPVVFEGIHRY